MPELSEGPFADGRHPSRTDLLLAAEGDLPEDELLAVRRHLRECEACQGFVAGTNDFVEGLRDRLDAGLEESVSQSAGRDFGERLVDAARESGQQRARLPNRGWLRVAAAIPLVFLLIVPSRFSPTLKANELLERAGAAEARFFSSNISPVRVRVSGGRDASLGVAVITANAVTPPRVVALFERAGLDWRRPLSVATFSRWRQRLRSKSDHVRETGDNIAIETRTSEGVVRVGRLWLAATTLRPIRVEWELADSVHVFIDDGAGAGRELAVASSGAVSPTASPQGSSAVTPTIKPVGAELDHAEVEVYRVLHRVGADLAEEITVRRASTLIDVSGVLSSPTRTTELVDGLRGIPHVRVRLTAAGEDIARMPSGVATVVAQRRARPALLTEWLENAFPDLDARQRFGAEALARARECRAHAIAWRQLVERYPEQELSRLEQVDRTAVLGLFASHRDAIASLLSQLGQQMLPIWTDAETRDDAVANIDDFSVAILAARVRRVDRLVLELFADMDSDEPSGQEVLLERLRELRRDVSQCRHWLETISRSGMPSGT